jgi:hypothetical protein
MLQRIVKKEYRGKYSIHPVTGMYVAEGYKISAEKHFRYPLNGVMAVGK